jgi:DNA-binding response OmpR family regulator
MPTLQNREHARVMRSSGSPVDNQPVRVLVAEDDAALRSVIERGLQESGYVVDVVCDGQSALSYLRIYDYEVAILDWRMPIRSGLDVVRELRRSGSPLPVLMLTARDSPGDRVAGLDEGADDYLVKPFDFSELLARLRALQRRPPTMHAPRLIIGDLEFDPATRQVRIGSAEPRLTGTEMSILEILMRRSPAIVPRRSIALHAWEEEADALGSNTIDVHMARLRAKLAMALVQVETVRGIGYRLVPR